MNPQKLVSDLIASGMTQPEIAAEIGCGQAYVSHIHVGKRGKRLSWQIADALKALHNSRIPQNGCDKDRPSSPTVAM